MRLTDLPTELLCEVAARVKDILSLSGLAGASRLLRRVAMSDGRLRVLYECHAVMTTKSNRVDAKQSSRNPFTNQVRKLNLVPDYNTHRYALYVIQNNWRWLSIDELEIRGEIDRIAGVKLRELFESPFFRTRHIYFTCCNFFDDDFYENQPLIGLLSAIFKGRCAKITFDRCSFDEQSLALLLAMFEASDITAFHFKYNFFDEGHAKDFCRSIGNHRFLVDLDMSSIGLGWDHHFLVDFLAAVAKTKVTHLAIRHNDLGLDFPATLALPPLPKLKSLNLVGNSLYSVNTHIIKAWLDSLSLTELIMDTTGIRDIHLWQYPIASDSQN